MNSNTKHAVRKAIKMSVASELYPLIKDISICTNTTLSTDKFMHANSIVRRSIYRSINISIETSILSAIKEYGF